MILQTLTGLNRYASRVALKAVIADFVKTYDEFGVERYDAAETEYKTLLDSVASQPFLTPRRLVVIEDPSANSELKEDIERLLDSVSESTDLIFFEPKLDKRSVLYKTLKKRTEYKEFNDLDEQQLVAWLVSEAKLRGGEISRDDARFLVQRVNLGQAGISNELDKLLSYDPQITKQTILLLSEPSPQGTVFDLIEAAFKGEIKRALELYDSQREQQVEAQAIMGMLAWQVHIMVIVKAQSSNDADSIAKTLGINPFVVRKTLGLVGRLTLSEVKQLVHKTLALDVRLKSESIDADDAIKEYLISLK